MTSNTSIHSTVTPGSLTYYCDERGNRISEGYHSLDNQSGTRGAASYNITVIPDPTRDSWCDTARIATGDRIGYDGTYWYLLDDNNTPNSEPYNYIWVQSDGTLYGQRDGTRARIKPINRTQPEALPDGTPLEYPPGATYSLANRDFSGHSIFVDGDTIKTKTGARVRNACTAQHSFTPPRQPPNPDQTSTPSQWFTVPSLPNIFSNSQSASEDSPNNPADDIEYWKTQYVEGAISLDTFESKIEEPLTRDLTTDSQTATTSEERQLIEETA